MTKHKPVEFGGSLSQSSVEGAAEAEETVIYRGSWGRMGAAKSPAPGSVFVFTDEDILVSDAFPPLDHSSRDRDET